MRLSLLIAILLLCTPVRTRAQGRTRTLSTDSGRVVLHYFITGQLSTREWTDKDDRWGRSWAFDRAGKELINVQTRTIGGHATVRFSYHANGAVSKAEVSNAPDGGIQWYKSTTTFDVEGNRTGFTEQGQDDEGPIQRPTVRVMPSETPRLPEEQPTAVCQEMLVNEVLLVNPTRHACKASVQVLRPSPAFQSSAHTLAPGDTLRLGTYSVGAPFEGPEKQIMLVVHKATRQKRRTEIAETRTAEQRITPSMSRYTITIAGWRRVKGSCAPPQ